MCFFSIMQLLLSIKDEESMHARSPCKKMTNRQSADPLVSSRLECCYLRHKIYVIFLSGNCDVFFTKTNVVFLSQEARKTCRNKLLHTIEVTLCARLMWFSISTCFCLHLYLPKRIVLTWQICIKLYLCNKGHYMIHHSVFKSFLGGKMCHLKKP